MRKIIFGLTAFVLLASGGYLIFAQLAPKATTPSLILNPTGAPTEVLSASVAYQGKAGADALTLLKVQATVEQDSSGLVTSINGRKADSAKKEYWAFYVNGKLSEVGPAQYKTKGDDEIEWKIEKY